MRKSNPHYISSAASGIQPYGVADMPEPPPLSVRGALQVIGPGAILAATAIGGGEWLAGPATAVKYGASLFGIATIAIVLQLFLNLESIRYTLYSGEPIYGAFLRLRPGPQFWAAVYAMLAVCQLAWPALALSAANTAFSLGSGAVVDAQGAPSTAWIAGIIVIAASAMLLVGGTIERLLEIASWVMLALIFSFLICANIAFVSAEQWLTTLRGFFSIHMTSSEQLDWSLLGALAVGAGVGGVGNLTISNWMRDKGYGMGRLTGAISSAVGSRHTALSPVGIVFPQTEANLRLFRRWWLFAHLDQVCIWAVFCLLGLFLTTNLAMGTIPSGTDMQGAGTGAYQAEYLARIWRPLWPLTLLTGFWILFSTTLGNTDMTIRTITDLLWLGSPRVRSWAGGRVERVYYCGLFVFTMWGLATVRMAGAFDLFKLLANMGSVLIVLAGVHILRANRKLPPGIRAPLWRQGMVVLTALFYGFFLVNAAWQALAGWTMPY